MVVDCGVWGARGGIGFDLIDNKKVYDYKLPTYMDEVEYFVSWVHTHFASSLIVWVYGFCEVTIMHEGIIIDGARDFALVRIRFPSLSLPSCAMGTVFGVWTREHAHG